MANFDFYIRAKKGVLLAASVLPLLAAPAFAQSSDGWQDLEDLIPQSSSTSPDPVSDDGWRDLSDFEGSSLPSSVLEQPTVSADEWQDIDSFFPADGAGEDMSSEWIDIDEELTAPATDIVLPSAVLSAGDLIDISVANAESLSGAYRISSIGTLVLPLIGSIDAAGISPSALKDKLEQLYGADYLVDPAITVTSRETSVGQVNDDDAAASSYDSNQASVSSESWQNSESYVPTEDVFASASADMIFPSGALSAGDLIDISVANADNLNGAYRISSIGTLVMPLIGSVDVAGLSPEELEARLEQLYEVDYLVDPDITVIARDKVIADEPVDEPFVELLSREEPILFSASTEPSANFASPFLAPGDRVEISAANSDSLNGSYRISPSGTLFLPRIGSVDAAGFTPDILEAVLEQRYGAEYFVDSDITVTANEKIIGQVDFEGLIRRAGPVSITSVDTLSSLLLKAGGVSGVRSNLDAIILRSANNTVSARRVSLGDIVLDNTLAPVILPGDQIKVLERDAMPEIQEKSGRYPLLDKVLGGGALQNF